MGCAASWIGLIDLVKFPLSRRFMFQTLGLYDARIRPMVFSSSDGSVQIRDLIWQKIK